QREKILGYVAVGARDGARLLTGGEVDPERAGYFVAPTIFEEVQPQDTIAQEEIFGPVIALLKAASVAEAIAIANSVRFGLSASVFTSSLETALRFVDEIDAGMVRVNEETAGVELQAPFGGVKDSSSHSREQGRAAIEFYTRTKTVALRPASGRGVM
ncbi:aldehyde dehydrogenase family protein, partial [Ferrimicrobium sp.]|uniref:aldehyde dehydrogenase family protein n=1 Tax=Ferrimicrobium sp. TaxID=2926050 RepID=UPI00260FCFA2